MVALGNWKLRRLPAQIACLHTCPLPPMLFISYLPLMRNFLPSLEPYSGPWSSLSWYATGRSPRTVWTGGTRLSVLFPRASPMM